MRLHEVTTIIEKRWPLQSAETWDNPGLAYGDYNLEVSGILLSVDLTPAVIEEATRVGAQLIISHHPALFRPITSLAGQGPSQRLLQAAIAAKVALYSAHTNVDHVEGGVTEAFAKALGLKELQPLDPASGHGRVGELESAIHLSEFAQRLSTLLPKTAMGVLVQGDPGVMVKRIGLLAGAGDSFLEIASDSNSDVYVTSDLRHHRALDFKLSNLHARKSLINVSHWAAESLWLEGFSAQLKALLPQVNFVVSSTNTDPWDFSIR